MKKQAYITSNWLTYLRQSNDKLLSECRIDVFKATGKGGQKKNKTSNAIRLTLSHLIVTESKSRSKTENIKNALKKLRMAIATDFQDGSKTRGLPMDLPVELEPYFKIDQIQISPTNPVFPIFIAALFDCHIRHLGNWSEMAEELGFTSSQIRKFCEKTGGLHRAISELNLSEKRPS
jgi:peptide chain release factor-like protein